MDFFLILDYLVNIGLANGFLTRWLDRVSLQYLSAFVYMRLLSFLMFINELVFSVMK